MICPSCGLLNPPLAESCVGCRGPLTSTPPRKPIDVDKVLEHGAAVARESRLNSPAGSSPKAAGPKQAREKGRNIHDVKEEEIETLLKDFLDRDFVKTDRPRSSISAGNTGSPQVSRIQRTLQKPDRAPVADPSSLGVSKPARVEGAGQPGVATAKKKQRSLFSGKVQRIEIDLDQPELPFSLGGPAAAPWTDPIHRDLRSAKVWDRFGAGVVDLLFIVGCWILFSLVVVFIPDFRFLSASGGLGLGTAFLGITLSYFFLFTVLGARTPGMDSMGLAVIRFDGQVPSARDVGLRIFGYCISLGCFGLGFLWAFFDPERLTWHDRISRTLVVEASHSPDN